MKQKNKYKQSTIGNTKFIDSRQLYESFIDPNSILVKIHDQIDFSFVNELCDDLYSEEGQNAYLPELVFKTAFIQSFKGGLKDNEVVRQIKVNMEYRYFLDISIDDKVFDDSKLSRFRTRLGAERFKQIFNIMVEKMKEKNLLSDDDVQYMDSFLFLADVKIVSINALLSKSILQTLKDINEKDKEMKKDASKRDFELSKNEQKNRFMFLVKKAQLVVALAKKKKNLSEKAKKSIVILARILRERADTSNQTEIRKKKKDEEKDKIMSLSDTDARFMGKKNTPIAPSYKSHVSMNKKKVITYTDVTLATIYDGHHAYTIVHDLKSRGFEVPVCVGDTHYGDMDFREEMSLEGTQAIAPYRENQVRNSCMTQDIMIEAWAYNHTQEYKQHMKIRSHVEPKQGEMKNFHGMKRAILRGIQKVRIQNYMSAIVTNCKLLAAS